MSEDKPKLLVLGRDEGASRAAADQLAAFYRAEVATPGADPMLQLRSGEFRAVLADVGDFLPLERGLVHELAAVVLHTIGEGVCIVDAEGRMAWSNRQMRRFQQPVHDQARRICGQALQIFNAQTGVLASAGADNRSRSKKFAFQVSDRYFEMICSPVLDDQGAAAQVVAVVWDATSGKRLQSKIDAIDSAGRELAKLDKDELIQLAPAERLRLLQDKIIRYSRDLMHFDHFNIRVLDRRNNKLEVVIAQGLPAEALEIDLYAQPQGNGISGFVGATGRSYICHDTEKDPRYVLGLEHCKSSLTVPLNLFDEVVGVYNIESESVGAFTEDDRQFAEIFGRYVALALSILDLLVVERCNIRGQVTDNVVQSLTTPLENIAQRAQGLLDRHQNDAATRESVQALLAEVEDMQAKMRTVEAGPQAVLGADASADVSQGPSFAGLSILVADDEPAVRDTIEQVLAQRNAEVFVCKDGYEACTLLEQRGFDLVVSDIRMPFRTGYEIFSCAQRYHPGLPVLLMTGFGYDPHHSIVRASQEGLAGVMFKPFQAEQLVEEVEKAVRPPAEDGSDATDPTPEGASASGASGGGAGEASSNGAATS
ncbi:MAG: response regulator [Planctomycetota bacterium]